MALSESDMLVLQDEQRAEETVHLSKETRTNGIQRCQFADCQIVLDTKGMPAIGREGARHWFANNSFERCTFVAKGKLKALNLTHGNRLVDCVVEGGPLFEAKFGVSPLVADCTPPEVRAMQDCDFTRADLRDAMFFQTDWHEVRLPRWPYISVLSRDRHAFYSAPSTRLPAHTVIRDQVEDFDWESRSFERSIRAMVFGVGARPHERQIQVCHAEDVARRGETTLERLRAELHRFAHPAIRY